MRVVRRLSHPQNFFTLVNLSPLNPAENEEGWAISGTTDFSDRIARFPAVLRELIKAELTAGNKIVELASCFPAPPAGAYVKLAKAVTTRERVKTPELDFYGRNNSSYSGEFTDAKRFYFVLEPPLPPEPDSDMDAIQAAHADSFVPPPNVTMESIRLDLASLPDTNAPKSRPTPVRDDTIVGRFAASIEMDYDKWHDGIGYDLTLLKTANPSERNAIEQLLLNRGLSDWRDIEALAELDSEKAHAALRRILSHGSTELAMAVLRHAPQIASEAERIATLCSALHTGQFYGSLSGALDECAEFHPPEVIAELFAGLLYRSGDVATHFAGMLMYLHGRAQAPFDWDQRPFLLKFSTDTHSERVALFRELCTRIGLDPDDQINLVQEREAARKRSERSGPKTK